MLELQEKASDFIHYRIQLLTVVVLHRCRERASESVYPCFVAYLSRFLIVCVAV